MLYSYPLYHNQPILSFYLEMHKVTYTFYYIHQHLMAGGFHDVISCINLIRTQPFRIAPIYVFTALLYL